MRIRTRPFVYGDNAAELCVTQSLGGEHDLSFRSVLRHYHAFLIRSGALLYALPFGVIGLLGTLLTLQPGRTQELARSSISVQGSITLDR